MKEGFIHFIWQYQYFDKGALQTTDGEPLRILQQGMYNRQDAGPDFKGSRLQIGGIDWHGDVELHLRASDWERHNHQQDAVYNSVILHVVWDDDRRIRRQDGSLVPQFSLRERVAAGMVQQYEQLMESIQPIPCAPRFADADPLVKVSMLDKSLLQRLQRKAGDLLQWLEQAGGDWETVAWWLLARNFGFKKNGEAFLRMAQNLPLNILAKHRNQPLQQEALLFGVAGFLQLAEEEQHEYVRQLRQEWQFLAHKYNLADYQMRSGEWKFLRMRPANFPTLRLAQLAAVVQANHHLFSLFRDEPEADKLVKSLRKPLPAYWQTHYHFGKPSKNTLHPLGISSAQNLLINTAAPLLAAYGLYVNDESWIERAMELLQKLPAEDNNILRQWATLGMKAVHAYDSQALLELFNEFCQPKKCLQCTIGLHLLKREKA
jgi:hypothetical protein